jgi:hypothetical protein
VESAGVECREFDVPTFGWIGRCSALSYACEHSRVAASRGEFWSRTRQLVDIRRVSPREEECRCRDCFFKEKWGTAPLIRLNWAAELIVLVAFQPVPYTGALPLGLHILSRGSAGSRTQCL